MDLRLYFRVLWRFRLLVISGVFVATSLALLSMYHVSFDGARPVLTHRQPEVWASQATLLVTQQGFPLGRSITEIYDFRVDPRTQRDVAQPRFADSDRFSELAALYARLATSDQVRALMAKDGPIEGAVEAEAVSNSSRQALPLIEMTSFADHPAKAWRLAKRSSAAFISYLESEQRVNRIPPRERIIVTVVQEPQGAFLFGERKITRPLMIFMAVLIAVIGLAFVLENLRPRAPVLAAEPPDSGHASAAARRPA
jgi:hypothetical protein